MIFIDGGYLKQWIEEDLKLKIDDFHFAEFSLYVLHMALKKPENAILVRTYYYDGLAEPDDKEYESQKQTHNRIIDDFSSYEIRTGRLIRDKQKQFRQKGVDVLMAIDMIEKANSNQYDIGIVVAGDLDHVEAVKLVKNKGKQIFGVCRDNHVAKGLLHEFDDYRMLRETVKEKLTDLHDWEPEEVGSKDLD